LGIDLPAHGIRYEWWGEQLGGRRRPSPGAGAVDGWRHPAFAGYAQYMATPPFAAALVALEARAQSGETLAIMCSETLWWRCHRRLIADALVRGGYSVEDLIDRVPGRAHELRT
jgi:uncharacterized protein (DUF488 family)